MKQRDKVESWALACVQDSVEREVIARHHNLKVAGLRLLLRVAALTGAGALVRGVDIQATELTAKSHTRHHLQLLRKGKWLTVVGGWVGSGHYELTAQGRTVCAEFATGQRRAARKLVSFEPATAFLRHKPLK